MDDAPSSAFADETPDDEVRIDWREPTEAELRRLLLGPDNLLNELTSEILRPRRQARLSWALTPEREQEAEILAAKSFSRDLLMRVATLLKAQAAPVVHMTLNEFKITKKFEIEGKLTAPVSDEALKVLHHRLQRGVTLLALDAESYAQGVAPEAEPDQMRMPFGEVAEEEGDETAVEEEEGETAVEAAHRLLTDQRSPEEKAAGEKKRRRKGEDASGDAPEEGDGEK